MATDILATDMLAAVATIKSTKVFINTSLALIKEKVAVKHSVTVYFSLSSPQRR